LIILKKEKVKYVLKTGLNLGVQPNLKWAMSIEIIYFQIQTGKGRWDLDVSFSVHKKESPPKPPTHGIKFAVIQIYVILYYFFSHGWLHLILIYNGIHYQRKK
jgi:hypothetical protein